MKAKLTFLAIAAFGLLGGAALVRTTVGKLNAPYSPLPDPQGSEFPAVDREGDLEGRKLAADILEARQKVVNDARAGTPGAVYLLGGSTREQPISRGTPNP